MNQIARIDFSESIAPLWPPKGVLSIFEDARHLLTHYPPAFPDTLKYTLAKAYRVNAKNLIMGNGSVDLLYRLFLLYRPKKICYIIPSFSEYPYLASSLTVNKPRIFELNPENNFFVDIDALTNLAKHTDWLVITNPHNPTGMVIDRARLIHLIESLIEDKPEPILLVDEAFVDFFEEASISDLVEHYPNLIILRSLTKFYALPGLRIGALLAHSQRIKYIDAFSPPWQVNAFALKAALMALDDNDYASTLKTYIKTMRLVYTHELENTPNIKVYPSATNFLLLQIPNIKNKLEAFEHSLLKEGISVRTHLGTGLDETFIRISIKGTLELKALKMGIASFLNKL